MPILSYDEKRRIIKTISDKGAKLPCSRCDQDKFTLLDGYFKPIIKSSLTDDVDYKMPSVPSVVLICNNCGYIIQHAMGMLELIPRETEKSV